MFDASCSANTFDRAEVNDAPSSGPRFRVEADDDCGQTEGLKFKFATQHQEGCS